MRMHVWVDYMTWNDTGRILERTVTRSVGPFKIPREWRGEISKIQLLRLLMAQYPNVPFNFHDGESGWRIRVRHRHRP